MAAGAPAGSPKAGCRNLRTMLPVRVFHSATMIPPIDTGGGAAWQARGNDSGVRSGFDSRSPTGLMRLQASSAARVCGVTGCIIIETDLGEVFATGFMAVGPSLRCGRAGPAVPIGPYTIN